MAPRHALYDFRRLDPDSDAYQHTGIRAPVRLIPQAEARTASLSRDLAGWAAAASAQIVEAKRDHRKVRIGSRSGMAAPWLLALFAECRAAWSAARERRVRRVIRRGLSHID